MRGRIKTMLTVYFDFQGIIMVEFLEHGAIIDSDRFIQTLDVLKDRIRRKCPELWKRKQDGWRSFLLHQDNAPVHVSAPTLAKYGEWGVDLLAHPPYSPDLAPCDFTLFPQLKDKLRGRRFRTLRLLQEATKEALKSFEPSFFEDAIADLVTRWKKCVAVDGDYFEGEHVMVEPEDFDTESEEENSDCD